jgi:hypothetical protein
MQLADGKNVNLHFILHTLEEWVRDKSYDVSVWSEDTILLDAGIKLKIMLVKDLHLVSINR